MKTVVACPLEGAQLEAIKHWARAHTVEQGPVDFVHIVERIVYPAELMVAVESPTPEAFKVLRETFGDYLRHQLVAALPAELRGVSTVTVLLANDPAEEMAHYLKTEKARLLVVGTRGLKGFSGLFKSSFAQHMLRNSPCDVLILRPR